MSAQSPRQGGRLDAREREVVYCHACSNEWYRDERGLACPACHSEITEIVSLDNDPRAPGDHSSATTSPEIPPMGFHADSDPDEVDLNEHLGQDDFMFRQDTRVGPGQRHYDPGVDPVLERFADLINEIGATGPSRGLGDRVDHDYAAPRNNLRSRLRGPAAAFPHHHHHHHHHYHDHNPREHGRREYTPPPRIGARASITRTTIGNGGTVTIFTGPLGGPGPFNGDRATDPFGAFFADVMRDQGSPPINDIHQAGPQSLARSIQDILGILSPANAMAGDAVYSQEALDRIITNLMETNPQSNAAPPASDDALSKLDRRKVTKDDLGGEPKTECSICIDDLNEGDLAAHLPCKHWFHEECVVAWLREHNTCPICRSPIEKNDRTTRGPRRPDAPNPPDDSGPRFPGPRPPGGAGGRPGGGSGDTGSSPGDSSPANQSSGPGRSFPWLNGMPFGEGRLNDDAPSLFGASRPVGGSNRRSERIWRSPSQQQHRWNEALRIGTSIPERRQRERTRSDDDTTSSATGSDAWRLYRRNSLSPTSPRVAGTREQGARMRERSPSQSNNRESRAEREAQRQQGHGPISWLRDRFTGGWSNQGNGNENGNNNNNDGGNSGSSNSGSSREERRY